jgi:hypothetical protein
MFLVATELVVVIPVTIVTAGAESGADCVKGAGESTFKVLGADALARLLGPDTTTGVINWYSRGAIEASVLPKLSNLQNVTEELLPKVESSKLAWRAILDKAAKVAHAGEDDDEDMAGTLRKFIFGLGAFNPKDGMFFARNCWKVVSSLLWRGGGVRPRFSVLVVCVLSESLCSETNTSFSHTTLFYLYNSNVIKRENAKLQC